MSLPTAETELEQTLGDAYIPAHWRDAITAVMEAENDHAVAIESINKLQYPAQLHTSGKFN